MKGHGKKRSGDADSSEIVRESSVGLIDFTSWVSQILIADLHRGIRAVDSRGPEHDGNHTVVRGEKIEQRMTRRYDV